jgi:hypothetical protein
MGAWQMIRLIIAVSFWTVFPLALIQVTGCDASASRFGEDQGPTAVSKSDSGPRLVANVPQESLEILIDQLDHGAQFVVPNLPDGDLKRLVDRIAQSQVPPHFQGEPAKGLLAQDDERKRLETQAAAIAQDLTTWDRLLTALEQPVEDAVRFTDGKLADRDSTGPLRTRLDQMKNAIESRPSFWHEPRELERYEKSMNMAQATKGATAQDRDRDNLRVAPDAPRAFDADSEPGDEDFPRVYGFVMLPSGGAADSVSNSVRIRTLDLRVALLKKLAGDSGLNRAIQEDNDDILTTIRNVKKLSEVPQGQSAAARNERLNKLRDAQRQLRELFRAQIRTAIEVPNPRTPGSQP